MLTDAQLTVVRDTLPAVGAAIDEITPNFYRRLFEAHPELERDLFNRGNQAVGAQQRSLAASIAMYATAVVDDRVSARSMLERVANKHASLGVAPDQYPVVYEHLFGAIAQVLGDAVTPAVAEAWTALYWQLADELITLEKGLYAAAEVSPETVWRTVSREPGRRNCPTSRPWSTASHRNPRRCRTCAGPRCSGSVTASSIPTVVDACSSPATPPTSTRPRVRRG